MSHLFQRPLCEMGRAYDYAYRPIVGEPAAEDGGGCDDRPHRLELFAATSDPAVPAADWRAFAVCPEHEAQLRHYDVVLLGRGVAPRFRASVRPAELEGGGG